MPLSLSLINNIFNVVSMRTNRVEHRLEQPVQGVGNSLVKYYCIMLHNN